MAVDKALIEKVLHLKPQDKFILIEVLVNSLDKPDAVINEIWIEEAEKRLKAHREGKTKGIPAEKVLGEAL